MNAERRAAVEQLSALLQDETVLLENQDYNQVASLLMHKQAALAALENHSDDPDHPDTEADAAAVRNLARLADENRSALQRALRVQDQIMGIMADAARRMMATPLYGGQGRPAQRKTSLAVAVVVKA